ncbi:hypothetical protein DLA51_13650 [Salmonella enterica]|nr:hypothetical protein [Salmonella enterica]
MIILTSVITLRQRYSIVAINHILALVMSGVMFLSASLVWSERRGQVLKRDEDAEVRVATLVATLMALDFINQVYG